MAAGDFWSCRAGMQSGQGDETGTMRYLQPRLTAPWRWLGRMGALLVAAQLAAIALPAAAQPVVPVASDLRIETSGGETRVIVTLDSAVEARTFALANPYRVIVDLNEVNFQLDAKAGQTGRGLVTSFRYGLFAPGKSRIVLDVSRPVLVTRDMAPGRNGLHVFTLTLRETDQKTFEAAYAAPRPRSETRQMPLDPDAGKVSGQIVLVIDPGHGGLDPGAVSQSGLREKDIVLRVARRLRDELQKDSRFSVHLTRDNDRFISLSERVAFAREKRADLFISIHADSIRSQAHSVRGSTVYTLSERASDAQAAALADKENRADLISGVEFDVEQNEVADILIDLVRRETKNFSIFFARTFIEQIGGEIQLNSNPHRFAGFHVLKAPDVPSVLIELGYLSNREDEALLNSPEWQARFARGAAEAVKAYFEVRLAGNGG